MAVKPRTKPETETETAAVDTTSATTPDASTAPAKTRKPRGPRGPSYEWIQERKVALAEILRTDKPKGTLRTAGSVATALNACSAFEAAPVQAKDVTAYVKKLVEKYEARDEEVPARLMFDRQRRTTVAEEDLDLFR